jgi:hypothetical protein
MGFPRGTRRIVWLSGATQYVEKVSMSPNLPGPTRDPTETLLHTSRPSLVGRLAVQDLPQIKDFNALTEALGPERQDDLTFLHAPRSTIALEPEAVGQNVFGSGSLALKLNPYPTREVESIFLNDGLYSGDSLAIVAARNRLLVPAIESLEAMEHLATYDPVFTLDKGALWLRPEADHTAASVHEVIVPVCAGGAELRTLSV